MKIASLVRRLGERQFVRFVLAGIVNTLFGLAVYIGCIFVGMPAWLAMLVGTVAGVAFNFLSLGAYAFRDFSLRRLPRFVGGYTATYFFNLGAFEALHRYVADAVWCQLLLTVPVALFSYLLMSRLVFRTHRAR